MSLAAAPASEYVPFSSILTGEVPNKVRTGIVVSTTLIVLINVGAEFPDASVTS